MLLLMGVNIQAIAARVQLFFNEQINIGHSLGGSSCHYMGLHPLAAGVLKVL